MKHIIESQSAPAPIGPYSQAVKTGSLIFCSGQIALDPETGNLVSGSLAEETHQVMRNLEAVLAAGDSHLHNVIKSTIFLTDMAFFGDVNEVYATYMGEFPPARETVAVAGLPKGVRVEISVIAHSA